jgi:hypothetical protein
MKLRNENRLTVVTEKGREIEVWNAKIYESIQDNGGTLKLFINPGIGESVCAHCDTPIDLDFEGDWVHKHLEGNGTDSRLCEPTNPDSKLAEEKKNGR